MLYPDADVDCEGFGDMIRLDAVEPGRGRGKAGTSRPDRIWRSVNRSPMVGDAPRVVQECMCDGDRQDEWPPGTPTHLFLLASSRNLGLDTYGEAN